MCDTVAHTHKLSEKYTLHIYDGKTMTNRQKCCCCSYSCCVPTSNPCAWILLCLNWVPFRLRYLSRVHSTSICRIKTAYIYLHFILSLRFTLCLLSQNNRFPMYSQSAICSNAGDFHNTVSDNPRALKPFTPSSSSASSFISSLWISFILSHLNVYISRLPQFQNRFVTVSTCNLLQCIHFGVWSFCYFADLKQQNKKDI